MICWPWNSSEISDFCKIEENLSDEAAAVSKNRRLSEKEGHEICKIDVACMPLP